MADEPAVLHEIAVRPGDPPFFRGEKGEWPAPWCDRIIDTGNACDDDSEYLIEWRQQPRDCGTAPVSGCCERHALDVDRGLVVRMTTYPAGGTE